MTSTGLVLDSLSVSYDVGRDIVRSVSLTLEKGGTGCLLGPSGAGKTTILRAIAGLEPVTAGRISLDGTVLSRPENILPPERRNTGMVFQDFALFPHLRVSQNIGFGLRRWSAGQRQERIGELLALTGLDDVAGSWPHELSGGQQQRVALARAIAPRPSLLLMDEPFSNIDMECRARLAASVCALLRRDKITALIVTHDQFEAFALADRAGVLQAGSLHQWDNPYTLYHEPADAFVAGFIGQGVMLPGTVQGPELVRTEIGNVRGRLPEGYRPGDGLCLLLRPDDIVHDDSSPVRLPVQDRIFRGADYLFWLALPSGKHIICLAPSHHDHSAGEQIGIRLDVAHLAVFPPDPGGCCTGCDRMSPVQGFEPEIRGQERQDA